MLLWMLACTVGTGADSEGGDPSILLLVPVDGATVCGEPLQVEVQVRHLDLVPPEEDTDLVQPGTGHVDIMLNGQDVSMIWEQTTAIHGVADGVYQLRVELSNADHSPVQPYAGDLAYITVQNSSCN